MNRRFGTRRFLCHEMERTQKINFERVYQCLCSICRVYSDIQTPDRPFPAWTGLPVYGSGRLVELDVTTSRSTFNFIMKLSMIGKSDANMLKVSRY